MMGQISISEALAKRNKIDPFLKRMVNDDEKWVTYYNIVRKRDCGQSVVKQLNRWPNRDQRLGRFYCVFGGTGQESFIRSCFHMATH
ncbi:hypothetical protein TNCV_5068381 [Trichonephila clavipes]|nr:hypothetical protein TNCV_5068381 [Trichonephila clavipes]